MIKAALFSLVCAGAVGAAGVCPACIDRDETSVQAADTRAQASDPKVIKLKVEGMTCGGCALGARKVLERLEGVKKAVVSYEKSEAVVTYDPSKVKFEQMVAALKKIGYTATLIEPKEVKPTGAR